MDYPFDTVSLRSDTIDSFYEVYESLKANFKIQFTGDINFRLREFEVFSKYLDVNILGSYVIKRPNNDCYVLFLENHFKALGAKGNGSIDRYDYQVWALAYLKKDFGRVMIRRETLTDKIIELIHPIELDFDEDKPFSDTFYVLVNDRPKASMAIDRSFRNAAMDIRHDDFTIEIINHTLIIGSSEMVSPEKAVYLAEFVSRICSMC